MLECIKQNSGGNGMKKIGILFIALLCLPGHAIFGQEDVEEMMRQMQAETQKVIDETQQAVDDYIAEQDAAFAKFLEEDWKMFQSFLSESLYEEPKPAKIPVAEPTEEKEFGGENVEKMDLPEPPDVQEPDLDLEPQEDVPEAQTVQQEEAAETDSYGLYETEEQRKVEIVPIRIDFFDASLRLYYDARIPQVRLSSVDNQSISKFWEGLSRTDFHDFLAHIQYSSKKMKVNDWGYAMFVYRIGEKLFDGDTNESNLFAWFVLSKSGYNVKVGYDRHHIYLLLPTQNKLYSTPYLTLGDTRYYIISLDQEKRKMGALYTYQGSYPGTDRIVDLAISDSPIFKNFTDERDLSFNYRGTEYTIPIRFSRDAVNFFQNYPQTNYEVYFSAKVAPLANYCLLKGLYDIIQGKPEAEAVNMILRFVQTAFEYKTDRDNFGREKPMFVEETIYYPYSDCEDRSVLFAHLVRSLLGLEVVGLTFPGHMATAVRFNSDVSGDAIRFNGGKYLICDPTYINASIGQCMPQFKSTSPRVIRIS